MSLQLFCSQCGAYLGPCALTCPKRECLHSRPAWTYLPAPGRPIWAARLPGAIIGQPLCLDESQMVVAWSQVGVGAPRHGGLDWLDPRNGQVSGEGLRFDRPVVGQVGQFEWVGFLALGGAHRLSNGAAVAFDLEQHRLLWGPLELPGALAGGPLVGPRQVAYACGDGQVHRLRLVDGERLPAARFLPSERSIAAPILLLSFRERFILPTPGERGQVLLVEAGQVRPLAEFDQRITTLARLKDQRLLAGLADGRLFSLEATGWTGAEVFYQAGGALIAPPLEHEDVLYFGGRDHCFYAIRLDGSPLDWSPLAGLLGTPSVTPVTGHGLLFVGDSRGGVYALDRQNGQTIWRYHVGGDDPLPDPVTSLSLQGERLLVGAQSGRLVCLPWHLGRYEAVIERLAPEESGDYYSAAADFTPQPKRAYELRQKAARAWEECGQNGKVAAMWQTAGHPELAAQAYQTAAEGLRVVQPEQAARYYLEAIELWNDLIWDGTPEGNRRAEAQRDKAIERLASLAGFYMPLLKVRLLNAPSFIKRSEGQFTFIVKNIGAIAAFDIRLYCGGGLENDLELPLPGQAPFEEQMPGQERKYTFSIRPSRQAPLRIDIHYRDYLKRFPPLQTTLLVPIEIDEALVLQTRDIGFLRLDKVQNLVVQATDIGMVSARGGAINQVNVSGMIAAVSGGQARQICRACQQVNPPGKSYCDRCGTKFEGT